MADGFKIFLTPPYEKGETGITLDFQIHDHPVAEKWSLALKACLQDEKIRPDRNFGFMGFPSDFRSLEYLCSKLNSQIEIVNEFGWGGRYKIEERASSSMTQEVLNQIHHHFEILSGQVWSPSAFFEEAPENVKEAIGRLNLHVHEIESRLMTNQRISESPDRVISFLNCALPHAPITDLTKEDREQFQMKQNFGNVVLHYCQRGKTHWESFHHKDESIDTENISGLRYLSGEFDIYFGYDRPAEAWQKQVDDFKNWLTLQGLEFDSSGLGLGWIHVAQFVSCLEYSEASQIQVREKIGENPYIRGIELTRQGEVVSRHYDDIDQEYLDWMKAQIQLSQSIM